MLFCWQEVQAKTGRDVAAIPKRARLLLTMSERVKRDLSARTRTEVDTTDLIGEDLGLTLTRAKLESLCMDLLLQARDIVAGVLLAAKVRGSRWLARTVKKGSFENDVLLTAHFVQ